MNITKHAFERMLERGFTPEMLGKFLTGNYKVKPSNDEDCILLIGYVDGSIWTLVVSNNLKRLITVRKAHKNEI